MRSFWAGWTFQRTYAESNGEPTQVLVATWMRDKFYFDELYEATVIRLHGGDGHEGHDHGGMDDDF